MHKPRCEFHPQLPAVARCAGCGRYLCRDCVVEVGARSYCVSCAGEAGVRRDTEDEAPQQVDSGEPRSTPTAASVQAPTPPPPQDAYAQGPGGPVGARVVTTCAYHPGVRAVTRCSQCGAFICAGCQRVVGNRRICEACLQRSYMQAQRVPRGRGEREFRPEPSFAYAPWRLWPGLAFLPVPFVLSGLLAYMMRQGDDISAGAAQLLVSLLLYSSCLFFAFIAVSRYGSALGEIGVRKTNLPSSLGMGFVGGAMSYWLAMASLFLSFAFLSRFTWIEDWLQGFFDVNVKAASGIDVFIFGLVVVIAAPICEEVFFRGYLYPPMREKLGVWGAVFLNGFLFSLVHFSLLGLLGRTLAGALFCLLYEYNDNLAAPITAHFLNNFVAFFLPIVAIWST